MDKKTILIVTETIHDINLLVSFLINDYNIYSANTLEQFENCIAKTDVDLVLIDAEFVKVNFENVKNTAKSINNHIVPILCAVDKHDDEFEAFLLENGAADCISKPYHKNLTIVKVDKLIKTKIDRDNMYRLIKERIYEINKSRDIIIVAMSILAESRDESTGEHIFRMQRTTGVIAKKYRELYPDDLSDKDVEEITLFAPLHDIGKIPIPDTVLKKEGLFTQEEFDIMKQHTILGGNMLLKTQNSIANGDSILRIAIEIATYHHEKYDGTGYPYGLRGDNIPISARIVSLADVYDALISSRVYKPRMDHYRAVYVILNGDERISPNHFDPKVIEAFKEVSEELKELKY